jgi:hypothetical protein
MATYAPRPPLAVRARALTSARAGVAVSAAGVGLLLLASVLLRTHHLGIGYWIDEGLSVGIADRPLTDIPGVLRLDGSPPVYYMLLHVWLGLTGSDTESSTRLLSLIFALLTIPLAFVIARGLFGARAGWIAGVLFALNPFLTQYAQETRMYALVMLLGTIATGAFLASLVYRRRALLPVFTAALLVMLYTHTWALFFAAACGLAWLVLIGIEPTEGRRALIRDGLLAFGGVALLYAPWIPTLLFQAAHTGAPWAQRPGFEDLSMVPARLLGAGPQLALLLAGGAGPLRRAAAPAARRRVARGDRLLVMAVATVVLAWGAVAGLAGLGVRYLSVAVAPLLLVCALGLARAGRLGIVAGLIVALMWSGSTGRAEKSNVRSVSESLAPSLRPGDLVISTWPEQIPVLAHYLPGGLSWATLWGPVDDLGVTDWRDGVDRLERTTPAKDLRPLLDALPARPAARARQPAIYSLRRWSAPWTGLVRLRSEEWSRAIAADRRFRVSAIYPALAVSPSPQPGEGHGHAQARDGLTPPPAASSAGRAPAGARARSSPDAVAARQPQAAAHPLGEAAPDRQAEAEAALAGRSG